jgi:hypothetical protein
MIGGKLWRNLAKDPYLQKKLEIMQLDCAIYTVGATMQYVLNDLLTIPTVPVIVRCLKAQDISVCLNLPTRLLVIPAQGTAFMLCHPDEEDRCLHYGLNVYSASGAIILITGESIVRGIELLLEQMLTKVYRIYSSISMHPLKLFQEKPCWMTCG